MNKYRNKKTELDGYVFDSKREANRWSELVLLQRGGQIKDLQRQVKLSIDIHNEHICDYIADFQFYEKMQTVDGGWKLILEDAKGMKTPVYNLKKKLVHAIYGYAIREV